MTDLQKTEEQNLTPIQAKWQEANYLAQASLLPKHFAGQPANVLVALELAKQLSTERSQLSPISVMQNLYVVHGSTKMYSKFKIALANSSGKLDHPIKYRADKNPENMSVEAYSSIGGDEISFKVDMAMAKAEGWVSNKKYQSMPMLMLTYRSASMLIDTHIPEVTMGIQTVEEAIDIEYSDNQVFKPTKMDTKALAEGDIIDEELV